MCLRPIIYFSSVCGKWFPGFLTSVSPYGPTEAHLLSCKEACSNVLYPGRCEEWEWSGHRIRGKALMQPHLPSFGGINLWHSLWFLTGPTVGLSPSWAQFSNAAAIVFPPSWLHHLSFHPISLLFFCFSSSYLPVSNYLSDRLVLKICFLSTQLSSSTLL